MSIPPKAHNEPKPHNGPLPPCGQPVPRVTPSANDDSRHWLLKKANARKRWWGAGIVLVLLAAMDFGISGHGYFGIDGTFGFWSWFGFLSCIVMIIIAKILSSALTRKDTYYDDE